MAAPTLLLNDGNHIPQIGLGTWPLNDAAVAPLVVTAIEAGYRHIDTAAGQIVLRWHMELGVVAIPKSATPVRIVQNIDIFDFALTSEEVAALSAFDAGPDAGVDSDTTGH